MNCSLKVVLGLLVAVVSIVVGAACLSVSLLTSLEAINNIGEAWANGMAAGAHAILTNSFSTAEGRILAANTFMNVHAPMTPYDLNALRGQNWSLVWRPFMVTQGAHMNYDYSSYSIVFPGPSYYYWMFSSIDSTSVDNGTENYNQVLDWIECPDGTNPGLGEIRYRRVDGVLMPPKSMSEAAITNSDLTMPASPTFTPIVRTLAAYTAAKADKLKPACFWLPPQFSSSRKDFVQFELFGACDMKNATGYVVGYNLVSLSLGSQLELVLTHSPRSKNGHNFIIDTKGYLVATTYSAPFFFSYNTTATAPSPAGCSNSALVLPNSPAVMGCRYSTQQYNYAPLAQLPADIYGTDSTAITTVSANGEDFIIVVRRFSTTVGKLAFNAINVIPKNDLLGEVAKGTNMAIGISIGLIAFAVIVAVAFVFWILESLGDVTKKMEETAQLEGLDKGEALEDDDKENHTSENVNNNNNKQVQDDVESQHEKKENSWIAEVANLETAYKHTVRSMTSFTRYVSRAVVQELILQRKRSEDLIARPQREANSQEINSNEKQNQTWPKNALLEGIRDHHVADEYDVTILIADIEGFSSQIWQTNRSNYDGVLYILHIYFKRICRLIMGHGGVVDMFMGDAVMSYWGAPVRTEHHALLAALSALSLLRETRRNPLKRIFETSLQRGVKIRCGLASGAVVVGTFGNSESVNYSVVGAPVTQARHLQGFNEYWSTSILMNGDCMRKVDDTIVNRLVCQAAFEPTSKPEYVYEVTGLNLDSRLARAKVSSDIRTIAFTDVLSLPTLLSNNEGVQEILRSTAPEHESTTDALLNWHAKGRTALPTSFVVYAEQFSEAARSLIEQKFSDAVTRCMALLEFRSSSIFSGTNEMAHASSSSSTRSRSLDSVENNSNNNNLPPNAAAVASESLHPSSATLVSSSSCNGSWAASNGSELIFAISDDQCLQNLQAIAAMYVNKAPPRHAIDVETRTFFLRAFKLDSIQVQGNDTRKSNKEHEKQKIKSNEKKSKSKKESSRRSNSSSRSRSGSQSGPILSSSNNNNFIDTVPHQTQQ